MSKVNIAQSSESRIKEEILNRILQRSHVVFFNDGPRLLLADDLNEHEKKVCDECLRKDHHGYYFLPPML